MTLPIDEPQSELSKQIIADYINKKYISGKNLTQQDFAKLIGTTRQTVAQLLTRKKELSASLLTRLGTLDEPNDFWLELRMIPDDLQDIEEYVQNCLNKIRKNTNTTSDILVDFEIINLSKENPEFLQPFEKESIRPISYYLRAGNQILVDIYPDNPVFNLKEKNQIEIPSKGKFVVKTLEKLNFPNNYYGMLGVTTNLSNVGVLVTHGTLVDPGFSGHMYLNMINLGATAITIRYQQPILSLVIKRLNKQPSEPYIGKNKNRKTFSDNSYRFLGVPKPPNVNKSSSSKAEVFVDNLLSKT